MVDRWIDTMLKQDIDWSIVHPYVMLDHYDHVMAEKMREKLETRLWKDFDFAFTSQSPLPERGAIALRRQRILANWKELFQAHQVGGNHQFILGSEDDSLPEHPHYFSQLLERLQTPYEGHQVSFVQGTIIGRWDVRLIPHWTIHHGVDGPIEIASGIPGAGWVPIDGGGWYGFGMTRAAVDQIDWKALETPSRLMTGPDVDFVQQLVNNGHTALGSWDLWVEHVTQNSTLRVSDGYGIIYYKLRWENEKWRPSTKRYPPLEPPTKEAKEPMAVTIDNSPDMVWCVALRTIDEGGKIYSRGSKFQLDHGRAKRLVAMGRRITILDEECPPGEAPPEPVPPQTLVRSPRQRTRAPSFGMAAQEESLPTLSVEGLDLAQVTMADPIPEEEYVEPQEPEPATPRIPKPKVEKAPPAKIPAKKSARVKEVKPVKVAKPARAKKAK